MSYAAMAAKGPKQSDEESTVSRLELTLSHRRAPQLSQLSHDDSSASSMVDVDSPHISSVPSDYGEQSDQTDSHAEHEEFEEDARQAREAAQEKKDETKESARVKKDEVKETGQKKKEDVRQTAQEKKEEVKETSQEKKEEAKEKAKQLKKQAEEKAEQLKREAGVKKEQAKREAKKAAQTIQDNSDNPVFIGNAVAIAAFGGVIGYGAYRKYTADELTWKIAGLWAGAVGLFGVADYYVSSYLFKKYPRKK